MAKTPEEMKGRTKQFTLRIIRLVQSLRESYIDRTIGGQLLRCGTSVGSNYRAACRARSNAEFRAKLGIVEEEADEVMFWMEILIESGLVREELLEDIMQEADEILSIVVASITTSRGTRR